MTARALLVVPYPISANRYWATRVVTPRGRPAFVSTYVTPDAESYKACVFDLARRSGLAKLSGPVALSFILYPERPQDWARRAKRDPNGWQRTVRSIDLDNAIKVMVDALKGVLFDDDREIEHIEGTRGIPDERGARVVIAVKPWIAIVQPELGLPLVPPPPPNPITAPMSKRRRPDPVFDGVEPF